MPPGSTAEQRSGVSEPVQVEQLDPEYAKVADRLELASKTSTSWLEELVASTSSRPEAELDQATQVSPEGQAVWPPDGL